MGACEDVDGVEDGSGLEVMDAGHSDDDDDDIETADPNSVASSNTLGRSQMDGERIAEPESVASSHTFGRSQMDGEEMAKPESVKCTIDTRFPGSC